LTIPSISTKRTIASHIKPWHWTGTKMWWG